MSVDEGKKGKWTEEEDEMLRKAVEECGEKQWKVISQKVYGRSYIQCLHRWKKILKPGLVKGYWSPQEDALLQRWVETQGPQLWSLCARQIPGRSGKQCRERWLNTLDPSVDKSDWKLDEDALIFYMFHKQGPKWTEIAKLIEGRTADSIKNRFYSLKRKLENFSNSFPSPIPENVEIKSLICGSSISSVISQIQSFHSLPKSTKTSKKYLKKLCDQDESTGSLNTIHKSFPLEP